MFNLELAIRDWKQAVQRTESVTQANIDELMEHLHESIADLVGKGLTDEEAFLVASKRLGDFAALSNEFGKVNGTTIWSRRVVWMLLGYVGGIALATGISGFSTCVQILTAYLGYGGVPAGVTSLVTGFLSWTIIAHLLYSRTRRNDGATDNGVVSVGWLAVLVVVIVAGTGLTQFGHSVHSQIVPMDQYVVSMWWTSLGGLVIHCCIIAACIGILLKIREHSPHPLAINRE